MRELSFTRLMPHFNRSLLNAVKGLPIAAYVKFVQTDEPALFECFLHLHEFFPATLTHKGGTSPTLSVLVLSQQLRQETFEPILTHENAREHLIPILCVYFNYLSYGHKSIRDKTTSKWDCTEQSLRRWADTNGIRMCHLSYTPCEHPATLSDYERGTLVARIALPISLNSESEVFTGISGQSAFTTVRLEDGSPIHLKRKVEKAAIHHSGIQTVCDNLYRQFEVGLRRDGRSIVESIINQSLDEWDKSLRCHNIPVAYRDFVDSVLTQLNMFFGAKIQGITVNNDGVRWIPVRESLREWVERLDVRAIKYDWGVAGKTAYELNQNKIALMRTIVRRSDLSLWGVPLPGERSVNVLL